MGLSNPHALGRDRVFYVENETTAGTFVKPTGGDQNIAKLLSSSIDLQQERKERNDARSTRSLLERITGKGTISWSIEAYVIPSGTAGTPPDLHELFYAAMGGYANVGGTSDTYSLSDSQTLRTLSITHHYNDMVQEAIAGAWVNTMTISASGGEEPKVTFEGGAMSYAFTGSSTLNGAVDNSTSFTVDDSGQFHTNSSGTGASSVVWFTDDDAGTNSDDNSGAGFKVTDDSSDPTLTAEANIDSGSDVNIAADGDEVRPFVPAAASDSPQGSPISGIAGSLKLDGGSALPITAFEVTLANNIKPLDDEAFKQFPDDVIPGFRNVTGSITFRARKDLVRELGKREAFTQRDIAVVLGSGGGTTCTINVDQAEFDFSALEVPEAEEGTVTLPFTALSSSASAADELDIVFS